MPKGHFVRTAEHKQRIAEAQKRAWETKRRENLPENWGKWNVGRGKSDEERAAISARNSGAGNSFFGKQHSAEAKAKMQAPRNTLKKYGITDEVRNEMREKGFLWCSNHKGFCPPDGFYPGTFSQCIACNLSINSQSLRNKLRDYGVDLDWYSATLVEQDGKCAICREPPSGKKGRLCVDHHHASNTVRALLCDDCNKGLGNFRDSAEHLQAAISYLQRFV